MGRYASLLGACASVGALAVLVAGCGNSRSILYKGISPGVSGHRIVISDATAVRAGKRIREQWLADIALAGREYPKQRFHNLPESLFRARLSAAAASDQFTVKRVEFLHPRQLAPLVIVQSRHYLAMAHLFGAVLSKSIDPIRRHRRPEEAFEGVFFEAQDERGVPFIIVSGVDRGPNPGGGEWARSEELYPGPHG